MESENYTWIKSPFWGILLLIAVACNDESKKTENTTTTNVAESVNQVKQIEFVDLPDSTIKTSVGKNKSQDTVISSNPPPKPKRSVTKKEESVPIVPPPAPSSIFDADKKNNDGYTPKN